MKSSKWNTDQSLPPSACLCFYYKQAEFSLRGTESPLFSHPSDKTGRGVKQSEWGLERSRVVLVPGTPLPDLTDRQGLEENLVHPRGFISWVNDASPICTWFLAEGQIQDYRGGWTRIVLRKEQPGLRSHSRSLLSSWTKKTSGYWGAVGKDRKQIPVRVREAVPSPGCCL